MLGGSFVLKRSGTESIVGRPTALGTLGWRPVGRISAIVVENGERFKESLNDRMSWACVVAVLLGGPRESREGRDPLQGRITASSMELEHRLVATYGAYNPPLPP